MAPSALRPALRSWPPPWPRVALALAALGGLTGLASGPSRAQEGGRPLLTFGFEERVELSDNPTLVADPGGTSLVSETSLSLALSTATPRSSLGLDTGTVLRAATGEGAATASNPRLGLTYGRQGANSAFSLSASYAQEEVAFLDLASLLDPDGGVVDPDDPEVPDGTDDGEGIVDLGDLTGEGTRRDASVSVSLALGQEGPLGVTLTARASATRYADVTSDALEDSERARVGAAFRVRLGPALDGNVRLGLATVDGEDEDGDGDADRRTTSSLDLGLSFARAGIDVDLGLNGLDGEGRTSLSLGRTIELPRGTLSFSLGATRTIEGGAALTGSLSVGRQLTAEGALDVSARRSVSTTTDGETVATRLSAGYSQPLTRLAGLSLDAGVGLTEDTATGEESRAADASARINWTLTRDWSLGTGLSRRLREGTGGETAGESAVFVTLGRSFAIRP